MFALGFSLGLTPLIGNLVGKNQVAKAGQTLRYGLIANLLLAILLIGVMSVVYVNIDRMGQPEELLPLIKPYFLIHLSGLIFIMLFNALKQLLSRITFKMTKTFFKSAITRRKEKQIHKNRQRENTR